MAKRRRSLLCAGAAVAVLAAGASSAQELDVTFPNGDAFVGSLDGSGVYTFANGARYEGGMAGGEPSGAGSLVMSWGDRYDGAFVNGAPSGEGVYVFADGAEFDGGFSGWRPHGQGELTLTDGTRFAGTWTAGTPTDVARTAGSGDYPTAGVCFFHRC